MNKSVIIEYEIGFPTKLEKHYNLAEYLRALGEPVKITETAFNIHLEWRPIFPGVPDPVYIMQNPWNGDKRKIRRIRLDTSFS